MGGLSRLQIARLDRMHPGGWNVAAWTSPKVERPTNDRCLGSMDDAMTFAGVHLVVNGAHVVISRRGVFRGYIAWGGLQYRTNGARRPWSKLVNKPEASGPYGPHRIPKGCDLAA